MVVKMPQPQIPRIIAPKVDIKCQIINSLDARCGGKNKNAQQNISHCSLMITTPTAQVVFDQITDQRAIQMDDSLDDC